MADPNWRVALDAASVIALFLTAFVAYLAYRQQRKTAETMSKDRILARIAYLEERDAGAPTREDFDKMSGRIGTVERDVSAINATLGGIQTSISGVQHGINLIMNHLLAQKDDPKS